LPQLKNSSKEKENISLIIELSLFFNLVMHPKWQASPDKFCLMSPVDDFLPKQKKNDLCLAFFLGLKFCVQM